jgi:hypothetical protein
MLWQFSQGRRAVIYVRVSTSSQTVENQIAELHEVAMRNGWHVALELTDSGTSGSEGRDQRPAFNELIQRATRREFDVVMVWTIDRLGRSIQQLVDFMNELQWLGIDRASGCTCPSQPAPHKGPSGPSGQAVSAKSCRDHLRNWQLRKQSRRQGCDGYKKRSYTARMVGQAEASLARVPAETSPKRLKLFDSVGVSPGGR